ncbi:hypothetical protein [Halomicrococcus sp. NG-SE-24]|uniref:hypothetical protein n=1 Tax=Halomicrococcus sp. NG-SE-24 TaxID=3436928 RepID=UPI003D9533DE
MVDRERALSELQIEGEFDDEARERHAPVVRMMADILEHGEVHARWADEDRYVEVRQGTATFDFDGEVILIDNGLNERSFTMNNLSNWEKPMNVFEDEEP